MSTNACILAIETASDCACVALSKSGAITRKTHQGQRSHSRILLDHIDALLKESSCKREHIDAIVCGNGPGSFMGVRLSKAVAKALAFSLQKPVMALSSLQIIAQAAHLEFANEQVLVIQDARKSEIYVGQYQLKNGIMQAVVDDYLIQPNQLTLAKPLSNDHVIMVGSGYDAYTSSLPENITKLAPYRALNQVMLADAAISIVQSIGINDDAHVASEANYVRNHIADKPKPKNKASTKQKPA